MQNESATSQGIIDIITPVIPEGNVVSIVLLSFLLVSILIIILYLWRMYMTPRGKARRRLKKLQRQCRHATEIDNKIIFQLADIVKSGLGLTCLTQQVSLPIKKQNQDQHWVSFIQQLDAARYSPDRLTQAALRQLMLDAKRGLK